MNTLTINLFCIRIAYERANIFVWDLNILNYTLQEAKLTGATEARIVTWKENRLDFEKEAEWFHMEIMFIKG